MHHELKRKQNIIRIPITAREPLENEVLCGGGDGDDGSRARPRLCSRYGSSPQTAVTH